MISSSAFYLAFVIAIFSLFAMVLYGAYKEVIEADEEES